MRKYAFLDEMIRKEFKTLGIFSRESGIPKSSLSMLITGRYQWNEAGIIKRVNVAIKRLRPDLDLSHIWDPTYAWYEKYIQEKAIVKSGFRIIVDCKLNEDGQLTIAPSVEGY
jgi:hypothetical protein